MGVNADIRSSFTVREDCVQMNPTTVQDPSLVLPVFRGIWLRTAVETDRPLVLDSTAWDSIAQLIAAALNLPPDSVILVSSDVLVSVDNDPIQELYFEFPTELVSKQDLKNLEELIAKGGYLDNALVTTVLELEVAGRHPVHSDLKRPIHKKTKSSKGSMMSRWKESKKSKISETSPKSKGKSRRL